MNPMTNQPYPPGDDEGGLCAPPDLKGWRKAWWWFDFIILVKLARLRFIAVLVAIGAVITQWDTLTAYYDKWTRPAVASDGLSGDVEWFCPMHPTIVRDNGREKCPICFMPLSKRKKGEQSEATLPAGTVNRVQLSPYRVVLGGINTSRVDYQKLAKDISAVGFVEFNERDQRTVAARVKGRIDTLLVNETGRMVRKDEELAFVYSPDLNVTMQSLLDARRQSNRDNESSALKRLELLGIGEQQIREATDSGGRAKTHVAIRSPITGHVINKYVKEGQYVEEGTPLYDVVDLKSVWIQAQVYEDDMFFLPSLKQTHSGDDLPPVPVTAVARAYPNEVFHGTLSFIYPHVDQATRTVAVRFEVANRDYLLKPGSTTTVTLRVSPAELYPTAMSPEHADEILAVPESSVIDTGSQKIVYRQSSPGVYDGVLVTLGKKMTTADGVVYFPVLAGVEAGDQVVTAGSFLVDAETRLNPAAGSIYFGGSGGKGPATTVSAVRPSTPEDEDAKIVASLAHLPAAERAAAESQAFCPVLGNRLGSMGVPVKVVLDDQTVFLCCDGCKKSALAKPKATLLKLEQVKARRGAGQTPATPEEAADAEVDEEAIAEALATLSGPDRALAEAQRYCAVVPANRLGVMGPPIKVQLGARTVFLCCEECRDEAQSDPAKTLKTLDRLQRPTTEAPK